MADRRTIRVEGLRDLQRAFAAADRKVEREFKDRLKDAAEPVRADAEQLAVSRIPTIGQPWSRMRVGVTRNSVYVAPRKRSTRDASRRRPNLAELLMGRAMLPALDVNQADVENEIDDLLGEMGRVWENVG